ncbi:MAG: hypothetical protein Q8L06_00370 [Pseudohongiella sp.]|nr:hypothetical protein [Pseudohongiella sp.]
MQFIDIGSLLSRVTTSNLRYGFDVSAIGQWSVVQRAALLVTFAIINALFLLALWYWLAASARVAEHAIYRESHETLLSIQSENQRLLAKNLMLQQPAFYSDVLAQNKSDKPELSYLLDLLRVLARSTQVLLLHVRPGVTDIGGRLSIELRAQVSLLTLASFWSGLIREVPDVELRDLDLQRIADSQKYELAMSLLVATGTHIDEQRLLRYQALADQVPVQHTEKGAHNKGFILDKDGKNLVYLRGDNHGQLHRVTSN